RKRPVLRLTSQDSQSFFRVPPLRNGAKEEHPMDLATFEKGRRSIATPSGTISYVEHGTGPVALFVHGVLLNGWLWRHQLAGLADQRRCIAVDLLAHGATEIAPDQDVSSTANATMLAEF